MSASKAADMHHQVQITGFRQEHALAARQLFQEGMYRLTRRLVVKVVLRSWAVHLWAVVSAAAVFYSWRGAMCLVGLAVIVMYVAAWAGIRGYVEDSLKADLSGINKFYVEAPGSNFWVAKLPSVGVVGIVALERKSSKEAELRRMSVHKLYRHHGIGHRLMLTLLDWAKEQGYSHVTLGTSELQTEAIAFYQKHGFKQTQQLKFSMLLPGSFLRIQTYQLEL